MKKIAKIKKNTAGIHKHNCFKCNKPIDELNDNFLKLVSYNDGELIEEVWFHLNHSKGNCWGEYNQDRVQAQLGEMTKMGFGILKNMGMEM